MDREPSVQCRPEGCDCGPAAGWPSSPVSKAPGTADEATRYPCQARRLGAVQECSFVPGASSSTRQNDPDAGPDVGDSLLGQPSQKQFTGGATWVVAQDHPQQIREATGRQDLQRAVGGAPGSH
jgi:hypothetical protein